MTLIQIDIPEELDRWVAHKSIDLKTNDKRITIIKILEEVKKKEKQWN